MNCNPLKIIMRSIKENSEMSFIDIVNLIKDKGESLLLRTETFNIIKILVKR